MLMLLEWCSTAGSVEAGDVSSVGAVGAITAAAAMFVAMWKGWWSLQIAIRLLLEWHSEMYQLLTEQNDDNQY